MTIPSHAARAAGRTMPDRPRHEKRLGDRRASQPSEPGGTAAGDEHPAGEGPDRRRTGRRTGATDRCDHPDAEPEARTLARTARGAGLAAHRPHHATHDRKTETRSAMRSRRRGVDPGEAVEQQRPLVGRDADPRVLHRDLQPCPSGGTGALDELDQDMAAFGELDRVAEEVGENLAPAQRIGPVHVPGKTVGLQPEIETLATRRLGGLLRDRVVARSVVRYQVGDDPARRRPRRPRRSTPPRRPPSREGQPHAHRRTACAARRSRSRPP
jgi:hypothetical protein